MAESYRVLITGSRYWNDYDAVRLAIEDVLGERWAATGNPYPPITIVHGAAPGADSLAARAAADYGLRPEAHPADWNGLGKAAGPLRNQEMVDLGADVCLAFVEPCAKDECPQPRPHDSHGTADCVTRARAAGIPVRQITSRKA